MGILNPGDKKQVIYAAVQAVIENQTAAKQHLAAAKDYEDGDHESAALHAFTAQRHINLVQEI